jgi:predicted PurR-regulated permease PerM
MPTGPRLRPSQVTLTTVLTACLGVVLVATLALFLFRTTLAMTLTLGSAMVAVALDHAVAALERRGIGRPWAIALVIGAITALLAGLLFLVVPPLVIQANALLASAPGLWRKLQHATWFVQLDALTHLQDRALDAVPGGSAALDPVFAAIGGVVAGVAGVLAFLFLSIFMLIFGRQLAAEFLARQRTSHRTHYEDVTAKIYESVGGYMGGLLGICALNAVLTTLFLLLIRLPYFLPLGILSGISSLVPYAGPLVVGVGITLVAAMTGGPWTALAAGVFFLVYGQLEGNVLGPWVYRRTTNVNPLVTLLAMLFLVEFMGLAGALLAVPLAAAAQIVILELRLVRREEVSRDAAAGRAAARS